MKERLLKFYFMENNTMVAISLFDMYNFLSNMNLLQKNT